MKKLVILAVALVAILSATQANAQKFGYVNMQEIVSSMPDMAQADTALGKYRDTLVQQLQAMRQEFQTEAATFVKDSVKMSEAIKEVKRSTLQDLQRRIAQFQQAAQQQMQQRQSALYKPIIAKAQKAVAGIAKVKGYTYVFNDDGSVNLLIVKPSGDDLTDQVKAKLGIK